MSAQGESKSVNFGAPGRLQSPILCSSASVLATLRACRRIEFVTRPSERIRIKAEAENTAEGVLEHIESGFFGDNAEPVFCSRSQ
jgi:hypothetical protein